MESMFLFVLTIAVAAVGGTIGYRLRLPAGVLVGAMAATVTFNILTERAVFYADIRIGIQVLAGAMIGSRMDMAVVRGMKRLIAPIAILVLSMFVLNVVFGSAMYFLSSLDVATALFAAAPGGASDMAIIAADLGAYPPYVALLQLSRLIIIFTVMPLVFRRAAVNGKHDTAQPSGQSEPVAPAAVEAASTDHSAPADNGPAAPQQSGSRGRKLVSLIAAAALGGTVFYLLGVTAGALIGGMVGGSVFCVLRGKVPFPSQLKILMQVGAGAFIGFRVERETLLSLGELVIPLAVMFVGIIAFSFGIAYVINHTTKLDWVTCMLASTPGGQQEMALLSEDLGADTPSIAIMQTARLVCVIAFFPTLLSVITGLVG